LVLLGAGHAHVQVLAALARQPWAGVDIALVSPQPQLIHAPMVAGYVAGRYPLDACNIAIEPLARAGAVTWHRRSVVALDAHQRRVRLDDGTELDYHWLSINTGAVQDRERIEQALPGSREHGLFVRPFATFGALWPKVVDLAASHTLRMAIVGGGDAGIELAMAIRHRLPQVALTLITGSGRFMAEHTPAMQALVAKALRQRRINLLPDQATRINADEVSLGSGARLACDVALIATGVLAPAWLQDSGLTLDASGFVTVDACLRSSSHANVFAAGDVSSRLDGALPRNGRAAMGAGPTLAANLAAVLADRHATAYVPPANRLTLLSCGDGRGLAGWGQYSFHGRLAWWYKDWLDRSFVRRHTRVNPGNPTSQAPLQA